MYVDQIVPRFRMLDVTETQFVKLTEKLSECTQSVMGAKDSEFRIGRIERPRCK